MTRSTSRQFYALTGTCWLSALLLLTACAATGRAPSNPDLLAFTLTCKTADLRAMSFELAETGELRYSAGPDVIHNKWGSAGTLTPAQIRELLSIVRQYKLTQAGGASIFDSGEKVTYHLSLTTAEGTNSLTALDDQVPGVKQLYDAVFNIYKNARYGA